MSTQNKEVVLGDVVKYEMPHELCRLSKRVTRILTATAAMEVGLVVEPSGAVAQVHTYSSVLAFVPDGGTYKLGYKGEWTTPLAFNANAAAIKAAFEALSTFPAGDQITASATCQIADTITWTLTGAHDEIELDIRSLTDGGVVCSDYALTVTTPGSTAADVKTIATGANCTAILLEKVTLDDLKAKNDLYRPFLIKGPSIVDGDQLSGAAAQMADAKTALAALGITIRTEPAIYSSGLPDGI